MDWAAKKCVPCEGGTKALEINKVLEYLAVVPGWQVEDGVKKIYREFSLIDFKSALAFINKIGDIAENEGHHPDINLYGWNHVRIMLWTHALKGLSENDFIIAAKINELWNTQATATA